MKSQKILAYGLLLAVPLAVLACIRLFPFTKGTPPPYQITIFTDKTVNDNNKQVPLGKDLTWVPLDHQQSFSIQFAPNKTPFAPGSSGATTPVNSGDVNKVVGDKSCPSGSYTDKNCYFPYDVCSKSGGDCPGKDPGVRVVPPLESRVIFWFAILIVTLSYTTYAGLRISSRKRALSNK